MRKLAALACALALLAGCAGGRHPYADAMPAKNITLRTSTAAGPVFSSVRATLDLYRVDAQCRGEYLGSVELDRPALAVGIEAGRWHRLVFDFASAGFLGGTRGRISREAVLRPRAGARYDIEATYKDDLYNVVLHEQAPSGALRELPLVDPDSCGAR